MKLKDLLNYSKTYLSKNNIDDAIIISKELIEYVFNIKKEKMIVFYEEELQEGKIKEYNNLLHKLVEGIPIQYIVNKQEFMGLTFYVDENVLIPQPDTEILVEEILNIYKEKACKILDLCTGSGAIAISLAKYLSNAKIVATDISMKAIQIAKLNAENNFIKNKITFIESDMFNNIKQADFDIIVSNPPYIKTSVIKNLNKQVRREPFIALDGGNDGLKFYKVIIENASRFLKEKGRLFLEIGYDQRDEVMELLKKNNNYDNIYSKKDLGGNDRIIVSNVRR